MRLIVSAAAAADIERLHAFLVNKNPNAARRAVATIVRGIQSLDALAERGRPSRVAGLRELVVRFGRSAYVVRYRYDAIREEVVIVRIWHGREARD